MRKLRLLLYGFFLLMLCLSAPARAQEAAYQRACGELELSGFQILGTGEAYGVPYARIKIPVGFSVTSFCRRVPGLSQDFQRCRDKIGFFNALHPSYVKTRTDEPNSIEADTLKVPLDLKRFPEIFPAHDAALAGYDKFLLVDIGKNFLGVYHRGELARVFPISPGKPGKKTPLMSFRIQAKEKNHYSTLYDDAWMPWSLLIRSPYFIHGGVLPGKSDSHGCIRMFMDDAKELYNLVDVGTPGKIVSTTYREPFPPPLFCDFSKREKPAATRSRERPR